MPWLKDEGSLDTSINGVNRSNKAVLTFGKRISSSIPQKRAKTRKTFPSTTGTGSELAYNAVFIDTKSQKKLGINTKNNPNPTEEEIRNGLEGNLCRCTGYHNIVKSVKAAADSLKGGT